MQSLAEGYCMIGNVDSFWAVQSVGSDYASAYHT